MVEAVLLQMFSRDLQKNQGRVFPKGKIIIEAEVAEKTGFRLAELNGLVSFLLYISMIRMRKSNN